jgi:hypothetical protein
VHSKTRANDALSILFRINSLWSQHQEAAMATIAIKDLPDSVELDRQAMAAIVGGARSGARYGSLLQAASSPARLVDYPQGFPSARQPVPAANTKSGVRHE